MAISQNPVIPDAARGVDPRAQTNSDKWVPEDQRVQPMDIMALPVLQPAENADIDPVALKKKLAAEWKAAYPELVEL
jgi:hypothetical protein